jgi:Ecdysteroid kinase-like family
VRTINVIERPSDLTAEWLTASVGAGAVADYGYERIGTGQMSECYRVALSYADGDAGPNSVVLKVAATDPVSRQTGLALGLYEREVRFYTEIVPNLDGPVAPCYHAGFDSGTGAFHLLLGDAGPAAVGDEIVGATIEQARLALAELGRLHAPLLGDTAMAEAGQTGRARVRHRSRCDGHRHHPAQHRVHAVAGRAQRSSVVSAHPGAGSTGQHPGGDDRSAQRHLSRPAVQPAGQAEGDQASREGTRSGNGPGAVGAVCRADGLRLAGPLRRCSAPRATLNCTRIAACRRTDTVTRGQGGPKPSARCRREGRCGPRPLESPPGHHLRRPPFA